MKQIILGRLKCNEKRAAYIESELKGIDSSLKPLLEAWLADETVGDDTQYEGYSVNSLMRERGMRFTGALLTIDWILKNPESALKALSEPIR